MEAAVNQWSVDKNYFEIQIKQLRIDNDQLLNQIMSQEIMHIVVNSVDIPDQFEKLVNTSRAKKIEKSHDPLALVAHTASSSKNTSSYYVTHPTYVVDYNDEYQQDDFQTNPEDPLTSAINQAVIQGDRVNIQSRNSGKAGRNNRHAYVQEEVVEGSNETDNVQRTLQNSSSRNTSTLQCYNRSGKDTMQGIVQSQEFGTQNISWNKCRAMIMLFTTGDDQIDSNIIFDTPNGNVNSGSAEKDTYVLDLYALEQLATNAYQEAEKQQIFAQKVVQIVRWIVDSGCSKHMTGDRVGQFCDGDLKMAFCSKTCYVQNMKGDDFLTGGRESNLYTIFISDMAASSPVCLMSKATSIKSWLWHRRFSHLNFGTINDLTRLDLFDGLQKFKYEKDHLCSACERGKSKKASHPPKLVSSDNSKLC
nr:integrase, catalytic region, zinc finger, CCHC-type, peptidase aspartic, catalytic [Tanacetum cinerariifolium]